MNLRWKKLVYAAGVPLLSSMKDLVPIVLVVLFFQIAIFRQPFTQIGQLLLGLLCVVLGLTLFVSGLQMALFPLGEGLARDFARKGSVPWLLIFAFSLGFGTTFAEPALIEVARKAAALQVSGVAEEFVESTERRFAIILRVTVAIAVGVALVIGVIRIVKGWPLPMFIIGGYLLVMVLTPLTPRNFVAVAYDSGGVTTSTITVPLTAALGVGLASSIQGRNPLLDGFGLIALASLTPILFVLGLGIALS